MMYFWGYRKQYRKKIGLVSALCVADGIRVIVGVAVALGVGVLVVVGFSVDVFVGSGVRVFSTFGICVWTVVF